jgi:hypothetical protein
MLRLNLLESTRGRLLSFRLLYLSEGVAYGFSATAYELARGNEFMFGGLYAGIALGGGGAIFVSGLLGAHRGTLKCHSGASIGPNRSS